MTSAAACDSYIWSVTGQSYNQSGNYTSVNGCNTEVLNLAITPSSTNTTIAAACDSYTWSVNGQIYNQSGSYTSVNGCNTEVLNISISSPSGKIESKEVCSSELPILWNNKLLSSGGQYRDTLVSQNGCDSIMELNLSVKPTPIPPSVNQSIEYCQFSAAATLSASGQGQISWHNTPIGGSVLASAPVPNTTVAGSVVYYASQTVNNCESDRVPIQVIIRAKPELGPPLDYVLCFGTSFNLYNSFSAASGIWMKDGKVVTEPTYVTESGTYVFISNSVCSDTAYITLAYRPPIKADAGRDDSVKFNTPYQLSGSGGLFYSWYPPALLNNPYTQNPIAILTEDTWFELVVQDQYGCKDKDSVFIKLLYPANFYVPTAFTPNGDGLNDYFSPVPWVGVANLEYFRVYNRFGQLVYETKDTKRGWDGKLKGVPQDPGNFVWVLKGKNRAGADKFLKGNVVLIR
jgi:gliding motility-associated-like protein